MLDPFVPITFCSPLILMDFHWNITATLTPHGLVWPLPCTYFPGLYSINYYSFINFEAWLKQLSPTGPQVALAFLPEITLATLIIWLLGVVAFELAENRPPKVLAIECWRTACCGLAVVSLLYVVQLLGPSYNAPVANNYLYISNGLTAAKLLVTLTSLFVLHLSENYIREHTRHVLEFSIILLLSVLLLLILVSANNLMLVFLSLAGFSLNLYILILYDGADAASREASLKYFYLSTLSAGLILFGTLLIYVMVGDVTYFAIRVYMSTAIDSNTSSVLSVAVLFILLGFFFKLSAFPGHLWAVEVYEGSPMPIMAFFILPVKVAVFVTFLRLLSTGLLDFSHIWLPCVTVAALGSLLWGAFAAMQERKTTRFLGYASINQIGFLLLGLVADTDEALRSALFYLILYVVMTGGFLLVFTHLRKENGETFTMLSDFRGLGKTENLICWNLSVFLFSMAGIPPLAGFFGKYYLMAEVMNKGLFVPAVVALAVSLITAYYYLRIIKTFWFEEDIAIKAPVVLLSATQRTLLSLLEVSLWTVAVFSPWFLPMFTEIVATLTLCADISIYGSAGYDDGTFLFIGGETHFLFIVFILNACIKMFALLITKIIIALTLMNVLYIGGSLFFNRSTVHAISFLFDPAQRPVTLGSSAHSPSPNKQLLPHYYVLRLVLELSGESVKAAIPHIGLLHRGTEKLIEYKNYMQALPHFDRLDYVSMVAQEHVFSLAVSEATRSTVPLRAQFIRDLPKEVARILSRLIVVIPCGAGIGAPVPFFCSPKRCWGLPQWNPRTAVGCIDPLTAFFLVAAASAAIVIASAIFSEPEGTVTPSKSLSRAEIKASRKADLRMQEEEIARNADLGIFGISHTMSFSQQYPVSPQPVVYTQASVQSASQASPQPVVYTQASVQSASQASPQPAARFLQLTVGEFPPDPVFTAPVTTSTVKQLSSQHTLQETLRLVREPLTRVRIAGDDKTLSAASNVAITIVEIHDPQYFARAMKEQGAWHVVRSNAENAMIAIGNKDVAQSYGIIKGSLRADREDFFKIDTIERAANISASTNSKAGRVIATKLRCIAEACLGAQFSKKSDGMSSVEKAEYINSMPVCEWVAAIREEPSPDDDVPDNSKRDNAAAHFEFSDTLEKIFVIFSWKNVFVYPSAWSVLWQYLYMAVRLAGEHKRYYLPALYISARFSERLLLESLVYWAVIIAQLLRDLLFGLSVLLAFTLFFGSYFF